MEAFGGKAIAHEANFDWRHDFEDVNFNETNVVEEPQ